MYRIRRARKIYDSSVATISYPKLTLKSKLTTKTIQDSDVTSYQAPRRFLMSQFSAIRAVVIGFTCILSQVDVSAFPTLNLTKFITIFSEDLMCSKRLFLDQIPAYLTAGASMRHLVNYNSILL